MTFIVLDLKVQVSLPFHIPSTTDMADRGAIRYPRSGIDLVITIEVHVNRIGAVVVIDLDKIPL